MQRETILTLAALASTVCAVGQTAPSGVRSVFAAGTLSGIIRDADGVPQMGALVQAVLPDATLGASAVTDNRGRYRLTLRPGSYRIRATAALFLPAVREHLQIVRGTRSVVDLTLATMLAPAGWLPATTRTSSEPSDDWMWTLRSSASRPILRFDTAQSGDADPLALQGPVLLSSSGEHSRRGAAGGRVTLKNSDGSFARGGSHSVLVLTRVNEDGSGAVLRADLSGPRTPYPVAPSAELSAGMQRRSLLGGFSRSVVTYSVHPELVDARGLTGMQGATLRTAQRVELGDTFRIDAGSVMQDSNLGGNALALEPFLRLAARLGEDVVLSYGMTEARGVETIEDLDRVQAAVPIAVLQHGHLRLQRGVHHAVTVAGKLPSNGTVEVAIYHDDLRTPLLTGTGSLVAADMAGEAMVADPTTSTFRVAGQDYSSTGLRVAFRQPVTKSLSAGVEYVSGSALQAARLQNASLEHVLETTEAAHMNAATVYVDGKVLRTGTTVRASYRWQPESSLTAVDAFRVGDDGAYLSCTVRQSLGKTRVLPQGLEAVIDLQNLLAEGYQPFLSNDGKTLFLAQTPRAISAGLSFSF